MHQSIAGLLFRAGARLRNPSLDGEYRRLKESESMSRERLEQLQLERAADFLRFAEAYSPFHKQAFAKSGFSARTFSSIRDIKRLPVLSKAELIAHNAAIHCQFDFGKTMAAETSGTSGAALEFRKSELWDSTNRAHLMRAYDWYGVKPWDRNGYFWGYDIAPAKARRIKLLDAMQNRFRLFRYDAESVEQFARELEGATYLAGYSSMIYETARIINTLGLPRPSLQMVKGTSEMILDVYQAEAMKAFGRRIVSEYGAAETGVIAFECPAGKMHINVEDVIVELDEAGDVLVTNIASRSFPIIRYRLGDSVRLSGESCPCGRAHPVLSEIVGRRGASIVGATGRYPALTFYYVFKNLAVSHGILLNYKAVQSETGRVTLFIEGDRDSTTESLMKVELDKYFGNDLECSLQYVPSIERRLGRKTQYFESTLA